MRRLLFVMSVLASPALALSQANYAAPPAAEPVPPMPMPPPPQDLPVPEVNPPTPQQPIAAPAGQWVNTVQYGWLWIPYAQEYTHIPPDPQVYPDQFVYYPAYGWRWVVAPWVYGYGPSPIWGVLGVRYFAWYSHPWFRVGGYWGWGAYRGWGNYRGWLGPRVWGPRGWVSAPAYYRTGHGAPHAVRVEHAPPPARVAPPGRAVGHGRGEHRGKER